VRCASIDGVRHNLGPPSGAVRNKYWTPTSRILERRVGYSEEYYQDLKMKRMVS
jgi:hypothetical protein